MNIKDELRGILIRVYGNTVSVEVVLSEVDPLITKLIGDDDTQESEIPKLWSPALKKQFINFRNHLRRQQRVRWGK